MCVCVCWYVRLISCVPGIDDDAPSPLAVALPDKESFQHIRALTGPAGSACKPRIPRVRERSLFSLALHAGCFSHRTLHWGGRNPPHSQSTRISMSFVASDQTFERSYLSDSRVVPPFAIRVALVCAQMLCYHEKFPTMDAKTIKLYFKTFQSQVSVFVYCIAAYSQ